MTTVEEAPKSTGPSIVVQGALFVAMTMAALGVGWFSGAYLKGSEAPPSVPPAIDKSKATPTEEGHGATALLVDLAPVTTNLASPDTVWVRLDASLMFDEPPPPEMAEAVHQDLLAYLRTVKMHQVEGASGFQHLREDLQERAAIRSGGHVKALLIRTLVFE